MIYGYTDLGIFGDLGNKRFRDLGILGFRDLGIWGSRDLGISRGSNRFKGI